MLRIFILLSQFLLFAIALNTTCHWTKGKKSGTCIGDLCVAFISRGIKANEIGQQNCISGIPLIQQKYSGCYDMDEGAGWICYCYTDLCNTIQVLNQQPIPLSERTCFAKTEKECTGITCALLIGRDSRYQYCLPDPWTPTFYSFFPNIIFSSIKDDKSQASEDRMQTTAVDYDFYCTKSNCSKILNNVISGGFPPSRPLIECALHPRDEQWVEHNKTCQGHFCILKEEVGADKQSQSRACLLVDDTHSDVVYTSGVITLEYYAYYICDRDYCNENLESTGFQRPVFMLNSSTPLPIQWVSFIIVTLVLLR